MRWKAAVALVLIAAKPPTEAERLAARAATVTIVRDDLGIAHIRAASDADAVFGMVYAQAEDDWNRVEVNYLTSLGRLAEAEGENAIWSDLRQRLWVDEADLQQRYRASPAAMRRIMDGWADGLNWFLATHPGRARALTRVEPWMALSFSEGSIGGDIGYVELDALRALYDRAGSKAVASAGYREPQGSNGIAIAPSRSTTGNALLLINPHTSFFFRDVVQVTSGEGLNVFGAVTWGQPFVYQGFNERVGWMHTTSGLDNRDEFAETLVPLANGRLGYRFGDDVRPVGVKPVTVRFRRADGSLGSRTFTTMATLHGPIIRSEGGKFIAFAIMNDPARALEQSFRRTKARDLKDYLAIAALRANSSNNTLVATADGEIAYLHPQFVPIRDERFDYRGVVSGADPRTAWRGLHSVGDLPNILNPRSGFVYNSNDEPWSAAGRGTRDPAAFPRYMDQYGPRARTWHALGLLEGSTKFDRAALRDVAYDRGLPGFDLLLPALLAAYDALPRNAGQRRALADPIALLRRWDRRWSGTSEALTLAVFWGEEAWSEAMGRDNPVNLEQVAYARMSVLSPARKLAALQRALAKLQRLYGGWRVPWGTINRYQRNDGAIEQRFDDRKPSLAVPFPEARWGTLASFVTEQPAGATRRYGVRGNSFVAVVEFTRTGPRAMAVTTGGVSGDPTSPHFADQAQAYADGRLLPVAFTAADIAARAVESYHPGGARETR